MNSLIKCVFFYVLIAFVFNAHPANAEIIKKVIKFDLSDLRFSRVNNYELVTMKNLELLHEEGKPQLPVKLIHLSISADQMVDEIKVADRKQMLLKQKRLLFPCQTPMPLSLIKDNPEIKHIKSDQKLYQSNTPYPGQIVKYLNHGEFQGANIVSFAVYPIQYIPRQKQLIFNSEVHVEIVLKKTSAPLQFKRLSNGNVVEKFTEESVSRFNDELVTNSDPDYYPYVIITPKILADHFKPLADWKTQKGLRAKIADLSMINNSYSGRDLAEKVRTFIQHAYNNWGTSWVLLGGDTQIVPYRKVFAMDCEYGSMPDENQIPCDLYFADLNGDWDANGNNIFGEIEDNIDMYPEVFLGRASLNTPDEVDGWVNKVLAYEKSPPVNFAKNMLFLCQLLWKSPYTDTGIGKDLIEETHLPPDFYEIMKLYESNQNLNKTNAIYQINQGQNIINHTGHAWWSLMSLGDGSLRSSDMLGLKNRNKAGTLFSIGCWPAAIDYDCVAESFIANPNGGGVAFIGNSRYGWGSPGNPGYGYSDRYDDKFFYYLFQQNCQNVGKAISLAKSFYVPFAQQENVYRWCMYEINLLGDPEMPIWTDEPKALTVQFPPQITADSSSVSLTITDGIQAIEKARVCLMQGDDLYLVGETDQSGQLFLYAETENAADDITLTVTASNYKPFIRSIEVTSSEPYISCGQFSIDDKDGNQDGMLNPGETAYLNLTLKNYGSMPVDTLRIYVSTNSNYLSVVSDTLNFVSINALDSISIQTVAELTANSTCKNGQVGYLDVKLMSSQKQWNEKLGVIIGAPVIQYFNLVAEDGNHNQFLEPGEDVKLFIQLKNHGLATAENVISTVYCDDPYIHINSPHLNIGNLAAEEIKGDTISIQIDSSCPIPYFPRCVVKGADVKNDSFSVDFSIAIGEIGFEDNLENGDEKWELLNPASNRWHLSTLRSHSGDYSWYCGREIDTTYLNMDNSTIMTKPFNTGLQTNLSFWLWYDVSIYSKPGYEGDGMHVEFFDGSEWHHLDFIGTGGALKPVLMGNDWLEYNYDLSSFEPSTNSKLKFQFVSDPFWERHPEQFEGMYLDDVKVSFSIASDVEQKKRSELPIEFALSQNYPNPFNSTTIIEYKIANKIKQSRVTINIYNMLGQNVCQLVDQKQSPGNYQVQWDGRDNMGNLSPSGIYLYQLNVGNHFKDVKKLLLLE